MKTLIIMLLVNFAIGTSNAAWEKVNGPFGMRVACIETDSFGNIFAGSFDGAILVSRDKGISWSQTSFIGNNKITGIVSNQKGLIYAASLSGGLFFSTDQGYSWNNITKIGQSYYKIALCADGELIMLANSSLYSSLDTGKTWQVNKISSDGLNINDVKTNNSGDVYVSCGNGCVYKRKHNEISWDKLSVDKIYTSNDWIIVGKNGNLLTFSTYWKMINSNTSKGYSSLFYSKNDGISWNKISSFDDSTNYFTVGGFDSNGDLYLCSENGINKGNILDSIFIQKSFTDLKSHYYAISFPNDDVCLLGSNGLGIFISEDKGNSWKLSNNGMDLNEIKSIVFNSKNDIFTSLNSGGIFKSDDNGNSWSKVNKQSNLYATTALLCDDLDILYAGTFSDGFFKSQDNGNNWNEINSGIFSDFWQRSVIDIKKDKRGILWGGCQKNLYYSYNNGETWDYLYIYSLSCFNILDTTLFYCASNGTNFSSFRSTDVFLKFDKLYYFERMELGAFTTNSKGEMFAINSQNVYKSLDSGKVWTQVNNGLKNLYINTIFS